MIAVETSELNIHVRIPRGEVRGEAVDAFLDWLKLESIAERSRLAESDADTIADEVKAGWWHANRHRFSTGIAS